MQLKRLRLMDWCLFFTIFYHVFISSYWLNIHDSIIWSAIGFILPGILGVLSFFELFKNNMSTDEYILPGIILFFVVLSAVTLNIDMLKFFIICLATSQMDKIKILKTYFLGVVSSIIFVMVLCLFKVLPMINNDDFVTYGFRNPNSIGFYLLMLFGICLVLGITRSIFLNLGLFVVIAYTTFFEMEDHTAFILLFLLYFLYIFQFVGKKVIQWQPVKYFIFLIPYMFTLLTFWIGSNFFNYRWMITLNNYFTSRPANWNYWMTNFDFLPLGIKMPTNVTFGHGALDGAFFTFPLFNGYLFFISVLLIISFGIFRMAHNQEYLLLIFILILLLFSISENGAFKNLYCPLVPLCLSEVIQWIKTNSLMRKKYSKLPLRNR